MEEARLITADMLDERVEFERGISLFPPLSIAIIFACVGIFGIELARGIPSRAELFVAAGAKDAGKILDGELWRLLSCAFLHADAAHLAGNMLALYVLGMGCEHAFGAARTLSVYLVSAAAAAAASCVQPVVAVGASGAVFGLLGLLGTVLLRYRESFILRERRLGIVLAIWAVFAVVDGSISVGIDAYGHAGGLAAGIAAGFIERPDQLEGARRPGSPLMIALSAGALSYAAVYFVPALFGWTSS